MSVIGLRLNKKEIERISKLSEQKKEAKSEVIRELLNEGWVFLNKLSNYLEQILENIRTNYLANYRIWLAMVS